MNASLTQPSMYMAGLCVAFVGSDADAANNPEINAQTAITSEFGKNASKAVGDYAATKLEEARKNNDQAGIEAWKEGGSARVALHTVAGGLTGGAQGADGATLISRGAGIVGSAATSAAAIPGPHAPTAATTAVTATGVGFAADVVEQFVRPDPQKYFREQLLIGIPANVLAEKFPLYAPVVNEVAERIKSGVQ